MRTIILFTAALLLLVPATDSSAECVIGVFTDPAGTQSVYWPTQFVPFDFYVVMWDEAAVEGVAYQLNVPAELAVVQSLFSPDESGFEFVTPGGSIIGFGECVFGFGGHPIQVAHYVGIWTEVFGLPSAVSISANLTESSEVIYASCSEQIVECPNPLDLYLTYGAPVESRSFAALKSLF